MSQPTPEIEAPERAQALLASPGTEKPGSEKAESAPPERPKAPRRRRWLYALVLVVLAMAGFLWYRSHRATAASAKTGTAKGGRGGAPAAIPVVSAQTQRGNIDVYVTGLGAITPIATVTVKSRVDGQLMNVHFKEGDLVFVEHYVMCGKCEWCHKGEYRLCEATDWRSNPEGIRYGYTSIDRSPHLWGGFAQYAYLPWNSVIHSLLCWIRNPSGSPAAVVTATARVSGMDLPSSFSRVWPSVSVAVASSFRSPLKIS